MSSTSDSLTPRTFQKARPANGDCVLLKSGESPSLRCRAEFRAQALIQVKPASLPRYFSSTASSAAAGAPLPVMTA